MQQRYSPLLTALSLIVAASMAAGCATTGRGTQGAEPSGPAAVYDAGRKALARDDFAEAIRRFRELAVNHPGSEQTPQARIELAYAYYKAGDASSAIAAAERFIRDNPDHPDTDYLYYLRGLARFDQAMATLAGKDAAGDPDSPSAHLALQHFSELIARFPDSKYSEDARNRITHLRNRLAERQLSIAKHYLGRGDYANAGLYARGIIDNIPDSAVARDAVPIANMAYRMLRLEETPATTGEEQPEEDTLPADGVRGADWLLRQDPAAYTIQLLSTSDKSALLSFIRRHRLKRELAYFETSREDTQWYSLVYGVFSSPGNARTAAEKLPPSLRDQRPWIRKVADVQAVIATQETAAGD